MKRVGIAFSLSALLGCDGYLATSGRLVSAEGAPLSGCATRVETLEGHLVQDWQAVPPDFTVGAVVAPGSDTYLLMLSCPGHLPRLVRIESGMPPKSLGNVSFTSAPHSP